MVAISVKPRGVAIIAGAIAALVIASTFVAQPVPDRVISLLGGPNGGVDRFGGVRIRYQPPAGSPAAEIDRVLAADSTIRRDGDVLVIELPGVDEEQIPALSDVLVAGGLTMREALEGNTAAQIARFKPDQVELDVDQWRTEAPDSIHQVTYLRSDSRDALERAIGAAEGRGIKPPNGAHLVLEHLERDDRGHPAWRTYELSDEVLIDGSHIASAAAVRDPNTARPVVLLDFTSEGAARFCDATRRLVGHKVATLLGGTVRSAPIINGAICGGRASITMGGSNPEQELREAAMLATVLSRGALPRGGTIQAAHWQPAPHIETQEWLGRLLLGVVGGALISALVFLMIRIARPSWRVISPRINGGFPYRRAAVTLLAPVALIVGRHLSLPGVNDLELRHVMFRSGAMFKDLSVIALGVLPVITSFVLVELVALAIPRLRWRRHDPRGRVPLGQAVAALSVVIALVQGFFLASYLELLSRSGAEVVSAPGLEFRLIASLSLATGTLLLALVAGLVREHGLGNGYGVLLVFGWMLDLSPPLIEDPLSFLDWFDVPHLFGLILLAAMVACTGCVLRWRFHGGEREPALRAPSTGVAPLGYAGLVFVIGALTAMGLGDQLFHVASVLAPQTHRLGFLAAVIGGAVVWSWVFARPAVVEPSTVEAGLTSPTRSAWIRVTVVSACLLVAIAVLGLIAIAVHRQAAAIASPVFAMVATAVLFDIFDDARAYRERLAPAGELHQIQRAGIVERVLADAGIRCHIHAGNLRAMFAFFAPWAPAVVLVPEAQAAEARIKIAAHAGSTPR
ncbi:MAG: protein-export rane protein SecD [Myxococcales bacterium]|nr:protein-export rane protein SecD [Myxococcales bacterium]